MRYKPLAYVFVSILFFVEPLIKIFYFRATTMFDFSTIMNNVLAKNTFKDVFDFWLIFPLAGLSLIKVRKWSYFFFISLMIYIIYTLLTYEKYTWPYNSDKPFMYNYIVVAISIIVLIYFLLPQVRKPFFDRSVRWWESKERFKVNLPCQLIMGKKILDSKILNISRTGAFLDGNFKPEVEVFEVCFEFEDDKVTLPAAAVSQHSFDGARGFGVKFRFQSFTQIILMIRLIQKIKKSHASVGR